VKNQHHQCGGSIQQLLFFHWQLDEDIIHGSSVQKNLRAADFATGLPAYHQFADIMHKTVDLLGDEETTKPQNLTFVAAAMQRNWLPTKHAFHNLEKHDSSGPTR
jgi:hypothetical protein